MEIRPAHENDIPAIVELLKLSLGESLMPKSEAFWRWKHIDNPFGKSPVILGV
jgi:N-acetylglutamate synthase-like GNAT family acetyltransferase